MRLLALLVLAPAVALAGTPQSPAGVVPKPHEALWLAHRDLPVPYRPMRAPRGPLQPRAMKQPHYVFGYLPYWQLDYDAFRWDLLTHLAYFAVEITASGDLGNSHKFMDPSTTALIAEAHANGVAVVLTATNFDSAQIGTLIGTAAMRKKVIDGLVGMMSAQGADGINIDFEFVPKAGKADFVTFLKELKAAVDAAVPGGGHVSIAGPAVDWSGAYDYDQIAASCDATFIMAYGYHWGGGNPGPLCPLSSGGVWGKYTLPWTIDDYVKWGGEDIRPHLIAGLPLYGYDWPSEGPEVPGKTKGKATAVVYTKAKAAGPGYGWKWDEASQTPYYLYESGGWHQVWADTAESLALKLDFTVAQQLGGVGFWALGYDGGDDAIWDEVEARYPPAVDPVPIEDAGPIAQDAGGWTDSTDPAEVLGDDVAGETDAQAAGDGGASGDAGAGRAGGGDVSSAGDGATGADAGPRGGVDAPGWGAAPDAGSFHVPGGGPDGAAGGETLPAAGGPSVSQSTSADGGCAAGSGGTAWWLLALARRRRQVR